MNMLWQLAVAATLLAGNVHGSHIRKDLVEIENDTIVLVDATTVIDSSSNRIEFLPFSPPGSPDGTKGLVYILPDLTDCIPEERSRDYLAATYIRVALISDKGDCPVETKIKQAEYDGAVGAIVYNTTLSASELASSLSSRLSKERPALPVMAVDRNYGETMRMEVASLQEEALYSEGSRTRAIFASLYLDEDQEHLSGWEISLISLVVILALCFCTSLTFHVSANRRRASRLLQGSSSAEMSKQILTLPSCALDRLALHTVTEADVQRLSECTTPLSSILNPSSKQAATERPGCCSGSSANMAGSGEGKRQGKSEENSALHAPPSTSEAPLGSSVLNGCIATCIVCIDDFVVGSKMRILPCGHNYHIECIDPWLTTKSSLCPLCKYDTRDVLTDLERTHSGPRILANQQGFEDIIGGQAYADSDDNASYLAESRSGLPLGGLLRQLTCVSHRIARPVRTMTRRLSGRNSSRAAAAGDIGLEPRQLCHQGHREDRPFENSNAILTTSMPMEYVMSIDGDDGPEMVEVSRYLDDNVVVEIKTNDPSPSPVFDDTLNGAGAARQEASKSRGAKGTSNGAPDQQYLSLSGANTGKEECFSAYFV